MKHTTASVNPFLVIRASVEAEVARPGILAISSALGGDGKTPVTAGLARSLAGGGYRTLAIDAANPLGANGAQSGPALTPEFAAERIARATCATAAGCDYLALASLGADVSSAVSIGVLYAEIRARYDYAVVDASVLNGDGLALARGADGVVLAVRESRAIAAADGEAVELLERLHARFLGVVATSERLSPSPGERATLLERLQSSAAIATRPLDANPIAELNPVARLFGRMRQNVVTRLTTPE